MCEAGPVKKTGLLAASLALITAVGLAACTSSSSAPTASQSDSESGVENGSSNRYPCLVENGECLPYLELPEPHGLLTIDVDTFDEALPEKKGDGALPVDLTITSTSVSATQPGTIKVQGSSTASWPKKNWTIKLFADEDREQSLLLKIGDSIPSDKWIAKAEWIDPSQMRNHASYQLWGDMVTSRTSDAGQLGHAGSAGETASLQDGPQASGVNEVSHSPDLFREGAVGYPLTFMASVNVDGDHYGLSTLTLGHDPRNFNIDPSNPKNYYMEFDARYGAFPEKSWEKLGPRHVTGHMDNYLSEDGEVSSEDIAILESLADLFNGSQEDFEKGFDEHLNKTNMIDMLLYLEALGDWDGVAQDVQFVSYDGEKWFLLPWDKDTTFGMFWDGTGVIDDHKEDLLLSYDTENPTQKPWFKTYRAFTPEVEERYAQLRDNGVFTAERIQGYVDDAYGRIPDEVWEAEEEKWGPLGRVSMEDASAEKMVAWFEGRLPVMDKQFNYSPGR